MTDVWTRTAVLDKARRLNERADAYVEAWASLLDALREAGWSAEACRDYKRHHFRSGDTHVDLTNLAADLDAA